MRQVSIAEAAKRLFALLDEVERGERIVIVRGGKRIARLLPVTDFAEDVPALIARMKAARAKRGTMGLAEILAARDERGR